MSLNTSASSSSSSTSSTSSSVDPVRERNNRIVKELSQRVVQGWTLLGQVCPSCHTALVRNREGATYCVACQLYCMTEEQARQTGATITTVTANGNDSHSNGTSTSTSTSTATHRRAQDDEDHDEHNDDNDQLVRPRSSGRELASLHSSPHFERLQKQLADENATDIQNGNSSSLTETEAAGDDRTETSAEIRNGHPEAEDSHETSSQDADDLDVQAHMARVNEISGKLGAKMMAGWIMMGVVCSNSECACPLMKNPTTGDLLCVSCGQIYTNEDENKTRHVNNIELTKPPTSKPSSSTVTQSSSASSSSSLATNGIQQRNTAADHQNTSASLARKSSNPFDEENDSGLISSAIASLSSVPPSSDLPSSLSSFTAFPLYSVASSTISDISQLLGEKLLQGYTLLAQECPNPNCSCPLVRKKNGPMLCVQCGSTVITQEEKDKNDKASAEKDSSKDANAIAPTPAATAIATASATTTTRSTNHEDIKEKVEQPKPKATIESDKLAQPTSALKPILSLSQQKGVSSSSSDESRKQSKSEYKQKRASFQVDKDDAEMMKKVRSEDHDDTAEDTFPSSSTSSSSSSSLATSSVSPQSVGVGQMKSSSLRDRPSALTSTRKYRAPTMTEASPSTNTPPPTPATPFSSNTQSQLPSAAPLAASISSGFLHVSHLLPPVPPSQSMSRNNSLDPESVPINQRGRFWSRSSSAAPPSRNISQSSTGSLSSITANSLTANTNAATSSTSQFHIPYLTQPSTGDNTPQIASTLSPALSNSPSSGNIHSGYSSILHATLDTSYKKLESVRQVLHNSQNLEQVTQLATTMKELALAIQALQHL